MDAESIAKIISGYGRLENKTGVLALTGGEPFSLPTELRHAWTLARQFDLDVYINTSAFFGKSRLLASRILAPYQGIARLEISIDLEHQRFVPLTYAFNVAEAANDLSIPVQFAVQDNEWMSSPNFRQLFDGFPWASIYRQTFSPVGQRNQRHSVPQGIPKMLAGGCGKVGNLLFDECGFAYPCCGSVPIAERETVGGISEFSLGSILDLSFEEIVARLFNSPNLELIASIGPSVISDILEDGSASDGDKTFCHTCIRLHRSGLMRTAAQELLPYVAIARSLRN